MRSVDQIGFALLATAVITVRAVRDAHGAALVTTVVALVGVALGAAVVIAALTTGVVLGDEVAGVQLARFAGKLLVATEVGQGTVVYFCGCGHEYSNCSGPCGRGFPVL